MKLLPLDRTELIGRVAGCLAQLETGVLDSLSFVPLLVHLEVEFGLTTSLDDLEFDNFRSIAWIAEVVAARNGAKAAR